MLDHLSLGVADLERAAAFYDAVLAPLGYVRVLDHPRAMGYGPPGARDEAFAVLAAGAEARPPGTGCHVAFSALARGRSMARGTTRPSSAISTATASRPCATLTLTWWRCKTAVMVRTQIQLPDELHARAKRFAEAREMSLAEVARRGIETLLAQYPPPEQTPQRWELPVLDLGGLKVPLDRLRDYSADDEMLRSVAQEDG